MSAVGMFNGLQVHVSSAALETKPRFPDKKRTKRRLRRVIGRYGSWYVHKPAIFQINGSLFVHPHMMDELRRRAREHEASLAVVMKW